jgi:hypothetical protein
MAWSTSGQSGFFINTMIAALTAAPQSGTPTALNINLSSQQNLSLVGGAAVNYTTAPLQYGSATPAWVNTTEVTGTGWATGGVLLSTAFAGADVVPTSTVTGSGPYVLTYNWTHALSVASTTLTGIYGCIIYFPNVTVTTGLVAKPELLALYFGSTPYATVAGTFGITPSGTGLAALTLTA